MILDCVSLVFSYPVESVEMISDNSARLKAILHQDVTPVVREISILDEGFLFLLSKVSPIDLRRTLRVSKVKFVFAGRDILRIDEIPSKTFFLYRCEVFYLPASIHYNDPLCPFRNIFGVLDDTIVSASF